MITKQRFFLICKLAAILGIVTISVAIFIYPFPGPCTRCTLLIRLSARVFSITGCTAFFIPPTAILFFFRRDEKVKRILKYTLLLWIPVLINIALVRELFEIDTNIGGIASAIFTYAHRNHIDFIFIVLPILAFDLLVLYLLGISIPGLRKK